MLIVCLSVWVDRQPLCPVANSNLVLHEGLSAFCGDGACNLRCREVGKVKINGVESPWADKAVTLKEKGIYVKSTDP